MNPTRNAFRIRPSADFPFKVLRLIAEDCAKAIPGSSDIRKQVESIHTLAGWDDWAKEHRPPQCKWACGEASGEEIAWMYLLSSVLKRLATGNYTDSNERKRNSLLAFVSDERVCHRWNSHGYRKILASSCTADEQLWQDINLARLFIRTVLGGKPPEDAKLFKHGRHGPGSNSQSIDYPTISAYYKYQQWPYDCTTACLDHARSAIISDQRWYGSLEDSYRRAFGVPMWAILDQTKFWSTVLRVRDESRIVVVPKTWKIDRVIAIEPTMNVYCQLAVDHFIKRRLSRLGFDLASPDMNRSLAREGSINGTFCTIDLSSASDLISLRLAQIMFPEAWYTLLTEISSRRSRLESRTVRLGKLATMGCGFTFSVETLLFLSLSCAVFHRSYHRWPKPSEVAVFGDDIVVPNHLFIEVTVLLEALGLRVNSSKSFFQGAFRESCGCDFVHGWDIRPVFLNTVPSNIPELLDFRNRYMRWLILNSTLNPESSSLIAALDSWLPSWFDLTGPCSDDDFSSYKHSLSSSRGPERLITVKVCTSSERKLRPRNIEFGKLLATLTPKGGECGPSYCFEMPSRDVRLKVERRQVWIRPELYRPKWNRNRSA